MELYNEVKRMLLEQARTWAESDVQKLALAIEDDFIALGDGNDLGSNVGNVVYEKHDCGVFFTIDVNGNYFKDRQTVFADMSRDYIELCYWCDAIRGYLILSSMYNYLRKNEV